MPGLLPPLGQSLLKITAGLCAGSTVGPLKVGMVWCGFTFGHIYFKQIYDSGYYQLTYALCPYQCQTCYDTLLLKMFCLHGCPSLRRTQRSSVHFKPAVRVFAGWFDHADRVNIALLLNRLQTRRGWVGPPMCSHMVRIFDDFHIQGTTMLVQLRVLSGFLPILVSIALKMRPIKFNSMYCTWSSS